MIDRFRSTENEKKVKKGHGKKRKNKKRHEPKKRKENNKN